MTRTQWMPIESAPKDGTTIVAVNFETKRVDFVYWDVCESCSVFTGWQTGRSSGQSYTPDMFMDCKYSSTDAGPTHWMPVPRKPEGLNK